MRNYLRGVSVVVILLLAIASAATVYLERITAIRASEKDVLSMRADFIDRHLDITARELQRLRNSIEARHARSSDVEALKWLGRLVPGTVAGLGDIDEASAQVRRELHAVRGHAHRFSYLTHRNSDFARIYYRSSRGFSYVMPPVAGGRTAAFHQFVMKLEWETGAQWKFSRRDIFGAGSGQPALWLGVPANFEEVARGVLSARIRLEKLRPLLSKGDSIGRSVLTGGQGITGVDRTSGAANGWSAAAPTEPVNGTGRGAPFFQQLLADDLGLVHRFPPGEPYWAAARASALPWSIVVIAAGLVGFTVYGAQWAEINERRRAERELRDAYGKQHKLASRLRSLANQMTTLQQSERKRLGALLHDDLQQLLVAARIRQGQGRLEDASELIGQAIDGCRDLTRQLRPPALYEAGLVPALRWLAEQMRSRYSLAVTVEAPHPDITEGLSDDLKMALFEGVRELLFNVVKHAGADRAIVTVRSAASRLHVVVEDRGQGFDGRVVTENRGSEQFGVGLFGVEERVAAVGGEMSVNSDTGQGTSVRLSVPLDPRSSG